MRRKAKPSGVKLPEGGWGYDGIYFPSSASIQCLGLVWLVMGNSCLKWQPLHFQTA